MDPIKCEAFLQAVDYGSLSAAAENLGYTQPGITRIIKALENEACFELLVRTSKGVIPTENGKTMIPLYREIVAASKKAEEMHNQINGILKGNITIGTYFSISARILPAVLKKFEEQYPNVNVKLVENSNYHLQHLMMEHAVDFCFGAKPDSLVNFEWIPIFTDENVIWLPKDHPRSKDSCYPISAFEEESFIQTMPNQDTDHDRFLKKYHLTPNIRYTSKDAYTTFCMVEAGLGVSINQRLIFEKWQGDVVALSFDEPQLIEMGIYLPSYKDASPASRIFIQMCKDHVMTK